MPAIHLCLEGSAARFPERMAARDPDGSIITFRELDERANRIAFLAANGVAAGDGAGPYLERVGQRWYNTGDVVRDYARDGFIYSGRRDRMVKRRGYRIEPGEIESCLDRHPAIAESAAIAFAHPQSGIRIVCYLAAPEGSRPSINGVNYQAVIRRFKNAEQAAGNAA